MRSGRLLAEDSPENLLRDFNLSSLEDVFLKLCMTDCDNDEEKNNTSVQSQRQVSGGIDNAAFYPSKSELDISEMDGNSPHQHGKTHESPLSLIDLPNANRNSSIVNDKDNRKRSIFTIPVLPSTHRLNALIQKNALQMFRNFG
jgi:hypothetical protein